MDLRLDVPGLSGNVEKDVKNLSNYVFQLSEQLRYLLYNLDVTNFNDLGLARYENGRLQIYTEKLQIAVKEMGAELIDGPNGLKAQIAADAEALRLSFEDAEKKLAADYEASAQGLSAQITQELGAAKDGIDEKVAQWQLTVDGFSSSFTTKLNEVNQSMSQWTQDANSFKAYVETAEGKIASWEVTEGKITALVEAIGENGEVTAASIVAAINDAGSRVVIDADHIDLDGIATFSNIEESDGQTVISGALIQSKGSNSWDYIVIDGGYIQVGDNGYLGAYDEGIVRLSAHKPRITGDSDVLISSATSAIYIYPIMTSGSTATSYGWRFTQKSIQHFDPNTGWTDAVTA